MTYYSFHFWSGIRRHKGAMSISNTRWSVIGRTVYDVRDWTDWKRARKIVTNHVSIIIITDNNNNVCWIIVSVLRFGSFPFNVSNIFCGRRSAANDLTSEHSMNQMNCANDRKVNFIYIFFKYYFWLVCSLLRPLYSTSIWYMLAFVRATKT